MENTTSGFFDRVDAYYNGRSCFKAHYAYKQMGFSGDKAKASIVAQNFVEDFFYTCILYSIPNIGASPHLPGDPDL